MSVENANLKQLLRLPLDPALLKSRVSGTMGRRDRMWRLIAGDTAAYSILTVGDLLYDAFRVDPMAVAGIDFARANDLSDMFNFSRFSQDLLAMPSTTLDGSLSQLQGYVAERIAATELRVSGAEVEFPMSSSNPGWDLLVNGEPFQVKCLASPNEIYEHFDKYPDIPVIANAELAGCFVADDRVTALDSLRHHDVVSVTRESLEAGADLIDLQIPLITGALSAVRAGLAVLSGESDVRSAAITMGMEVGGKSMSATGGAGVASAGLILLGMTGGWIAVIGPLIGSIAGYHLGGAAVNRLKQRMFCQAEAEVLMRRMGEFAASSVMVLQRMIDSAKRFRGVLHSSSVEQNGFADALLSNWLSRIDREIEERSFYLRRLGRAIREPLSIAAKEHDLRFTATQLMWTAAQAGVLPANVRGALARLTEAIVAFERANKRWLLA